jgi:hypothetical protein
MSTTAATTPDLDAFCARHLAAERAMVALQRVQAAVMRRRRA